jgi:hypothetical protein
VSRTSSSLSWFLSSTQWHVTQDYFQEQQLFRSMIPASSLERTASHSSLLELAEEANPNQPDCFHLITMTASTSEVLLLS